MARSSIYGADDTAMASRIASEALAPPMIYAHSGTPIDQGAESKGEVADDVSADADSKSENVGGGSDSRACPEGNHGKSGCHE